MPGQRSVNLASSFQGFVLRDDLRAPQQEQCAFFWLHLLQLNQLGKLSGSGQPCGDQQMTFRAYGRELANQGQVFDIIEDQQPS